MNAKDLMIGDWVKVHFGVHNETIGSDVCGQVAELYDDGRVEVAVNDAPSTYWNIEKERGDEILSIPFTSEILEKNGFEKKVWRESSATTYAIGDGFHIELYEDEFWLVDNCVDGDYGYESNWIIEVKYVHELQHALKLCKIDKEIIL